MKYVKFCMRLYIKEKHKKLKNVEHQRASGIGDLMRNNNDN